MDKKLYRSRADAMVSGVCGGLGQYLGIDSSIVRIFFVVLTFFDGVGLLIYFVLAIVLPRVPEGEEITQPPVPLADNPQAAKFLGGGLVLLGLVALINNLNFHWLAWLNFGNFWPLLLIIAGGVLLWRVFQGEE